MVGDAMALAGLTGAAEPFRLHSCRMYGSGSQYASNFESIVTALPGTAPSSPESPTNTVDLAGLRYQTQTLVQSLADLKAEVASLKASLVIAVTNGPPVAPAA
jgi:hypothetical protein